MICSQCKCNLEDAEISDINRLSLPQWCTECIEAWANDWDEKRIDVIGQNGNTGEHYEH